VRHARRKLILAATSVAGLLLAVAGMMPAATAVESLPGRLVLDLPAWLGAPFVALICLSGLFFIYLMASGLRMRVGGRQQGSPGLLLMLLLASALWLEPGQLRIDLRELMQGFANMGSPPSAMDPSAEALPPVHAPVVSGLLQTFLLALALIGAGVMAWLWLGIWPSRAPATPPPATPTELQAAVEDSLDDLRHLPDVRQAIIRCYARFERVLAGADLRRPAWQTAMEFMRVALKHPRLPRHSVQELTSLFDVARFSRHDLGPAHREQAWQALSAIKAALEQEGVDAAAA
jgi:hypothetical protein